MKLKQMLILLLATGVVLTGCTQEPQTTENTETTTQAFVTQNLSTPTTAVSESTLVGDYSDKDLNTDYTGDYTDITLADSATVITGDGATSSGDEITINGAGTYVLSGTLSDGKLMVNAGDSDDIHIIFDGVDISALTGSPVEIINADKVIITLEDHTVNTLSDTANYDETLEANAVIYSKSDLTLNGNGSLTLHANFKHGINAKDDLVIVSGNITIQSLEDAIRGKDSVSIADGTFNLTAGGDGIKSNNDEDATKGWILIENGTFNITAGQDGIQAETTLLIENGTFEFTTGGGASENTTTRTNTMGGRGQFQIQTPAVATEDDTSTSYKGIKAGLEVVINNGVFSIDANDDAIHSNGAITIQDGDFTLATGDDGVHADETLTINGGTLQITESYEGLEAVYILITGGDITIKASDDGINAAGDQSVMGTYEFKMTGGTLYVNAEGDGLDSNGNITIEGGDIIVDGPTQSMNGALDYDHSAQISGGTLIAMGSSGMAQAPSTTSSQNALMIYFSATHNAGQTVTLKDASGNTLLEHTPEKAYQTVVFSTSDLKIGSTYKIFVNDSEISSVTLTTTITTLSDTGQTMNGGFGNPGGNRTKRP